MIPSTGHVREFGTASLFAMLVLSTCFFGAYVGRAWLELDRSRRWPRFCTYENKAAIAWLTACLGAAVKNGAALLALHLENAGEPSDSSLISIGYLVGTFVCLWGMVCLMRALSRYDWPRGTWPTMVIGALAFAVIFVFA